MKRIIESRYQIAVSVRTARQANDILDDAFRGRYKAITSNVFTFRNEDDYEYALEMFNKFGVEVE